MSILNRLDIDKLNIIENIDWVYKLAEEICNKELHITKPTIIFEPMLEEGRYYFEINIISINSALRSNKHEVKKALYHELRHAFQYEYIKNNENELVEYFKSDLKLINSSDIGYSFLEIDAYYFQKLMMKKYDNIIFIHPNYLMDCFINKYEEKFKKYFE